MWLACIALQEAIFNKSTGKVILKTFSLYKKLLTLLRAGHDQGKMGGAAVESKFTGSGNEGPQAYLGLQCWIQADTPSCIVQESASQAGWTLLCSALRLGEGGRSGSLCQAD